MNNDPVKSIQEHIKIRAVYYPNSFCQLATRTCISVDSEIENDASLVSTAYVNKVFGLPGGSEDELASKEYVDKLNEKRKEWPEEYYPYQPDLPTE